MSSFNRVLIMGRLGLTPTLQSTQNGKPFCRLSVATQAHFSNSEGERSTSWHSVHVFGKEAENASRYLRKGGQVLVEGRIDTKMQMKEGKKNFSTFITADHLTYVSSSSPKSHTTENDDSTEPKETFPEFTTSTLNEEGEESLLQKNVH